MGIQFKDYQIQAIENMRTGCILNGDVGSGKSLTSIGYFYKLHGGDIYKPIERMMANPSDIYIITTAKKRDDHEWDKELNHFLMHPKANAYSNTIVIDSWQNIKKYIDVTNAFFIFDEQRLVGSGAWVKSFYKIARKNDWILLTATPGDNWGDYIPVFVANGFYKNKTEFENRHAVYSRYIKWKVDRYVDTSKLITFRDRITVHMQDHRQITTNYTDLYLDYDIPTYKNGLKMRWNHYENRPIESAPELCYYLRKIVNSDISKEQAILELLESIDRVIIFYNYNYELDILKNIHYGEGYKVAEYNGHKHESIPNSKKWIYLVQYTAGCEGWNCVLTDSMIFYSQNYSYRVMHQASGRINRMNTPFKQLNYYILKSKAPIDIAIERTIKKKKKFNASSYFKGIF